MHVALWKEVTSKFSKMNIYSTSAITHALTNSVDNQHAARLTQRNASICIFP